MKPVPPVTNTHSGRSAMERKPRRELTVPSSIRRKTRRRGTDLKLESLTKAVPALEQVGVFGVLAKKRGGVRTTWFHREVLSASIGESGFGHSFGQPAVLNRLWYFGVKDSHPAA